MKEKLIEKLKTKYSNLGFSDDALNEIAEKRIASGGVTDENLDEVVNSFEPILNPLQKEIDRRVTSAKKGSADKESFAKSLGYESYAEMEKLVKKTPEKVPPPVTLTPSNDGELRKLYDDLRNTVETMQKEYKTKQDEAKREQFAKDVRGKLIADKGCDDNVYLKLVMHELDINKSLDENVEGLRKRYDEETTDAKAKGYYSPELSSKSILRKVDDKELDAAEKAFAKDVKENNKIG